MSKYDLEKFALYGPAHGSGHSEVEGLWLSRNADFIIQPGMLFNIDIWLSDGINGLRYEDGVLVTEKGLKQLSEYLDIYQLKKGYLLIYDFNKTKTYKTENIIFEDKEIFTVWV